MPHSSGGGSHGGGSHGGSGSSGSAGRTSRHYFAGCRTYVYYRHSRPYYIYGDYDMKTGNSSGAILGIIVLLVMVAVFGYALFSQIANPHKLKGTDTYQVEVIDKAGIFSENKTELKEELQEFKELTGIVPIIVTITNDTWRANYNYLTDYAYDYYVDHFNDEKHWVIVYATPADASFTNWSWEGMQGDNTDNILNDAKLRTINADIQANLENRTTYTVEEAFTVSFSNMNEHVMTREINYVPAILTGLAEGFLVFCLIGSVLNLKNGYKKEELVEITKENVADVEHPATVKCEYCGGEYVKGIHKTCPHCGASIIDESVNDIFNS